MRNNYEVRAQKFIREIAPFFDGCNFLWDYEGAVLNFMMEHPNRKIKTSNGLARIALITSDYVVKIEYNENNVSTYGGGEAEIAFYKDAEADGFEYLFAKVSRYEYNGKKYYIMPRIRNINIDRWEEGFHFMTDEEVEWCEDHELYDLHGGNYGFRNGKICIIDYACNDYR